MYTLRTQIVTTNPGHQQSRIRASWRNGSAFDSRSKGYPFKSGRGHFFCLLKRL
ncbi:hypothetical protein GCG54_00013315 [Colletotrichum gloeosporioides]|uniref:Uncharacterized protein n=1 Tax=Colletotrichum gloeosporioides TaxID=474922 RepID=A0A8H4FJG2_COLGL|nr:uncharacterized protein GCG54_00013315 [Colletotrichum gloeosporioides]KAF3803209.1 hypothetical protein GCG54_00013315 [Colletotrichum gloeosporioides]